jgi:hypothetical protein
MTRPKIKKVDTAKRKKERKEAQRQLAEQTSMIAKHPKECCVCQKPFERTHETVKTWMVVIREAKKVIRLTCPQCWETVERVTRKEKPE